jgi:hypothetical protein
MLISRNLYNCENYLFGDYHLKSGITTWIITLRSTAYYKEVEVGKDMVISIC